MCYQENGNKGFEKPLEKHKCFYVVHIVFFRYHADKLITEDIGNDKPRNGTITFSDRFCIMLKMFAFHPCGVLPTSAAMVPTFSFTSPNIVDRLPFIAPIRISFIHSLIASSMLCIGSYPRLTEQAGKQRYKDSADKGNASARHELFNAL